VLPILTSLDALAYTRQLSVYLNIKLNNSTEQLKPTRPLSAGPGHGVQPSLLFIFKKKP
jgi:hypothetical protein